MIQAYLVYILNSIPSLPLWDLQQRFWPKFTYFLEKTYFRASLLPVFYLFSQIVDPDSNQGVFNQNSKDFFYSFTQ